MSRPYDSPGSYQPGAPIRQASYQPGAPASYGSPEAPQPGAARAAPAPVAAPAAADWRASARRGGFDSWNAPAPAARNPSPIRNPSPVRAPRHRQRGQRGQSRQEQADDAERAYQQLRLQAEADERAERTRIALAYQQAYGQERRAQSAAPAPAAAAPQSFNIFGQAPGPVPFYFGDSTFPGLNPANRPPPPVRNPASLPSYFWFGGKSKMSPKKSKSKKSKSKKSVRKTKKSARR